MKRFFIPLLGLLLATSSLFAQKRERIEHLQNREKKPIQFGYYIGLNKKGFKISYNTNNAIINRSPNDYISVEESFGFNIGLTLQYRLNDNIGVRFEPGLSSNTKKIIYSSIIGQNGFKNAGLEREISGTYLRFPLLFKLSTNRLKNMRAFVIGGASYDYNFSSNQNNVEDNQSGQFRMKTNNFMYEVGVGVDLYLYFFKFSPSIRGVFAINNEIVPDNINTPYTDPISFFGTRGVFLNFTFE